MRSDVSSTKKGRINIMDLITQLAIDLDAFLYDYDTYGYAMVTDPGYDHAQDY